MSQISQAMGVQARVIGALLMRELHTRYGRQGIGFAWFIGEPMLFTLGVVILWSQIRAPQDHGLTIVSFTLTGYTPLLMWRHCFSMAVNALKANGSLLYHRQVTFLDVILARCLIDIAGAILTFCIAVVVLGAIFDIIDLPDGDPKLMMLGWLLYAWFCVATALLVASVTELSHIAEKAVSIVGYVMIPLCGAFWMVDWLPERLQAYALYVPSVDAYEMIRAGFYADKVKTIYDPVTACAVNAVMTLAGLGLLTKARNHLTIE